MVTSRASRSAVGVQRGGDSAIRWSTTGAVLCVAVVAAVVSYRHAYALVRDYGEDGWTAWLVPLTVDGLIFASSMVLLHSARRQAAVPKLARWLLGLGIAATLAANAAHGLDHGLIGAVVAAWPAIALVGTYELLMLLIRNTRHAPEAVPEADAVLVTPVDAAASETADVLGDAAGSARPVALPNPLEIKAAKAFADELAAGRVPTIRTIRSRLRIGQARAQQARAHLAALVSEQSKEAA